MLGERRLGVVGAGNMGQALIAGVLRSGLLPADRIVASRRNEDGLEQLRTRFGVEATTDNVALIRDCDVILLAIKPQGFQALFEDVLGTFRRDHFLVSIAAGVSTAAIEARVGVALPVVRAMPNTPALVGRGITAYCLGKHADATHALLTSQLLGAVGRTLRVDEKDMDAVTALSGSGPAYVFYLTEAMATAGAALGLEPGVAAALARQTVVGASALMESAAEGPKELRRRVTSRGGTTEAAIKVLDETEVSGHVRAAMEAAAARAAVLDS